MIKSELGTKSRGHSPVKRRLVAFFVFSQQVCWSELASDFLVLAECYLTIVEVTNASTCGLGVQQKNEIASLGVNLNMTVMHVKKENWEV